MTPRREADWLHVAEARERILGAIEPLPAVDVPLADALGQVLAEDADSPLSLPPWDNSAMDGFAVRSDDVRGASEAQPRVLRVVDDIAAGGQPSREIGAGEAARVMTGAPVPDGADGVIRVEHTDADADADTAPSEVRIRSDADAGRNIRRRGEDLRTGERVLEAGTPVRAAEIGVLASVGRAEVPVVRRPEVAVLASGDELVDLDRFDEALDGRRIISTNSYSLAAQLREAGCEVRELDIARDSRASLREHIERARGCDALITTGGISVGARDYVQDVLDEIELETHFWRVRVRPGSPLAFGRIGAFDGMPWFGLPGNPVSAMVGFEVFARPALLRMAGHTAVYRPTVAARLTEPYRAKPGLTHFVRVRLDGPAPDGEPDGSQNQTDPSETRSAANCHDIRRATLTGPQGSGILTSMAAADALLVIPEENTDVPEDRVLPAIMLSGGPPRPEPGY